MSGAIERPPVELMQMFEELRSRSPAAAAYVMREFLRTAHRPVEEFDGARLVRNAVAIAEQEMRVKR